MATRFFLALLIVCALYPAAGLAQRDMGIIWDVPQESQAAQNELRSFIETGFNHIQISRTPDNATWDVIDELGVQVYVMLPIRFPITHTFAEADSSFKDQIANFIAHFSERESVAAVGLFAFGPTDNTAFENSLGDFFSEIKTTIAKPRYYQTAQPNPMPVDSLFSFRLLTLSQKTAPEPSKIGGYVYRPDDSMIWDLGPVKKFLEQTATAESPPVFFDGTWLQSMQQKHPQFRETLKLYATTSEPAFALSYEPEFGATQHDAVIIALLLAWVIFAVTYHSSPVFRKSMARYFTGHKFYVNDVMQRHIRTPLPGTAILIQHTMAGGILFYCVFNTAFSSLGLEVLYSHYPMLALFDDGNISLFITGCMFTLILESTCIAWLIIANTEITHYNQVFNLYPWPLQINLFVISLLLTLFMTGQHPFLVYVAAFLFVVILLSAFVISAMDCKRLLHSKRLWFISATVGLYTVILIAVLIWILASDTFLDVIYLAASQPI